MLTRFMSASVWEAPGLSVFLLYKEGSSRQGRGSLKYAVPGMKWVGLRPSQLEDLDLPHQVRLLKLFAYAQTSLEKTVLVDETVTNSPLAC